MTLAEVMLLDIPRTKCKAMIENVEFILSRFPIFAEKANLPKNDIKTLISIL